VASDLDNSGLGWTVASHGGTGAGVLQCGPERGGLGNCCHRGAGGANILPLSSDDGSITVAGTPEPSTLPLAGLGCVAAGSWLLRKRGAMPDRNARPLKDAEPARRYTIRS